MPAIPYEHMPSMTTHDRLVQITRTVIEEAAERGNAVIVGRGAAFILRGRPSVLHVQLHASIEARIRYLLMRVEEIPVDTRPDERSLEELCRSVDNARAEYIRRLFGVDWLNVTHYDLAIDTGRLGVKRTVDLIENVAREGLADAAASPTDDAGGG
jgi:CMP/dCMP kinase